MGQIVIESHKSGVLTEPLNPRDGQFRLRNACVAKLIPHTEI